MKDDDYGKILAKNYYDKLFKEYALIDLTFYQLGKIGMRWRTKREVLINKGTKICGNVKCKLTNNIQTFEVNFGYIEKGKKKNTQVKVNVCPNC